MEVPDKDILMHKPIIDLAAAFTAGAAILHYMPEIAGLLSVIWYIVRFIELIKNKNVKD